MKYRVVVDDGENQSVVLTTDDLWIACTVADTIEKYPICQDIWIEKEKDEL